MTVFFDTETEPFGPANKAPRLVCVTWCTDVGPPSICTWREAREWAGWALQQNLLVAQNTAYDTIVLCAAFPDLLPLVFRAYQENRITDTILRQKLADIGRGRYRGFAAAGGAWVPLEYDLESLGRRHGWKVSKEDPWRLRYGELRETPLEQWPAEALHYALNDASAVRHVYQSQASRYHPALLVDEYAQARRFFALDLCSAWGIRTSARGVESLRRGTEERLEELKAILVERGLVRFDGSRNVKAAAERMRQAVPNPRLTKGGNICLDSDACNESGDPLLESYSEFASMQKVLSNDVKALSGGTVLPIHTRFDMAVSGRSTSAKPNIQNPRRLPGVRECFVPRVGSVYASADYDGLELRTVAQTCIKLVGFSRLAEILNPSAQYPNGQDPHLVMAGNMLGRSYDDIVKGHKAEKIARKQATEYYRSKGLDATATALRVGKEVPAPVDDARQTGKVGNFGFWGGLGVEKFILWARKTYKVRLTEERATFVRAVWRETYPENRPYFAHVSALVEQHRPLEQLFSGRILLTDRYTAACNTYFQGLGADLTGHVAFLIQRACYAKPESVLYGCRMVNYVHDDFILEVPETSGHECAHELSRIMVVGAAPYLPDVPATAKPKLSRYWSKDSEQVWKNERLIPWPEAA